MKYTILKRWYVSDGDDNEEIGWKVVGRANKLRKAKEIMHKDVREVEIINEYQSPYYGGIDDCQQSIRTSKVSHTYDMADSCGSEVNWLIVKGRRYGTFTTEFDQYKN